MVVYTQKTFYCMPGKSGMCKEGKKELVMNVVFCLTLEIFFFEEMVLSMGGGPELTCPSMCMPC